MILKNNVGENMEKLDLQLELMNDLDEIKKAYIIENIKLKKSAFSELITIKEYKYNDKQFFTKSDGKGGSLYFKKKFDLDSLTSLELNKVYEMTKEINLLQNKKNNNYSTLFYLLGGLSIFVSFFLAIDLGEFFGLIIFISGFLSGSLLIAVGEIIRLLHTISLK